MLIVEGDEVADKSCYKQVVLSDLLTVESVYFGPWDKPI